MMPYVYGSPFAGFPQTTQQHAAAYQSDAFLDDLSRQLASVSSTIRRRHSRGSHYGSRTPGSVMRIAKPSSANNSPQSSTMMQARRRLLINNDGGSSSSYTSPHRLPLQLPQEYLGVQRYDTAEAATTRPARPVSWHPSSTYFLPNQMPLSLATHFQIPAYTTPATAVAGYEPAPSMQPFPLSPAAYSNQTSPSTAFSPYSGNFDSSTAGHFYSPNPWALSPSINTNGAMFDKLPSPVECPALVAGHAPQQQVPASEPQVLQQQPQSYSQPSTGSSSSSEWNALAGQGFSRATVPPTPPDNNCISVADPAQARIPSEGDIACQTLEEDEPEGEILVGMGLYDPPEKEVVDPTLQSYRSSVAQLLGAAYKYPEPTGKGLKLEDAWEPPENLDDDDQEEDDDNDEERDAEGEEHES